MFKKLGDSGASNINLIGKRLCIPRNKCMKYKTMWPSLHVSPNYNASPMYFSKESKAVKAHLNEATLTALRFGSTQMVRRALMPPCLAIRRQRWLPSRASPMMQSTECRSGARTTLEEGEGDSRDWRRLLPGLFSRRESTLSCNCRPLHFGLDLGKFPKYYLSSQQCFTSEWMFRVMTRVTS